MERKNQLLQQLQALRKQLPTSAALTTQISKINAKQKLQNEQPIPFTPPFDPVNFTLSDEFFSQKESLNTHCYDLDYFTKNLKNSILYDQITQNNTISTYLEPDQLSPEFIDFANARIEILSITRMNEIIHRALFYEFSAPQFQIQTTQDLLVKSLNPIFDIETELMGDERAYLQKVQNRSQSRIDDIQIYMKFSELEIQKEWKVEIKTEFQQQINIQQQFAAAQISSNAQQKLKKYKVAIKSVCTPRNWQAHHINNQVITNLCQNFTNLSHIITSLNSENPLNLPFKLDFSISRTQQIPLDQIEDKLISGQSIRQQHPFETEFFMNNSFEVQSEFRRKAITSCILTPEFNFLQQLAGQKWSGMELACELLIRTREAQLSLLLLQEINEIFWYFSQALFEIEGFTHSSSEFHVIWNGNFVLFTDSEVELEMMLESIQSADEQEFLFNLEKLVENKVAVKNLVQELFILMNKMNLYHAEMVVFMSFVIRNENMQINQNLTAFIQEINKYAGLDQRKYKYGNYYKNNVYRSINLMINQLGLYRQFDLPIESVFASIIESARLELYYVYQVKNNTDSINQINSPYIQCLMLQIPALYTAIQGGLKEVGAEISIKDYERTETEFDSFFNIQGNIQYYTILNCFKEYGNQRFLQNLDNFEQYSSQSFEFVLNLASYKADLPPNLVQATYQYLTALKQYLIEKFEFHLYANIIPFRALNIKSQRDTFSLVISKYDYFSSSIDEIVQSNLPMTTSTVFLTQKDKSNIPKLFVNYVYLLAFSQFVWSQESFYKARQALIQSFQIVEFNKSTEFDFRNFNFLELTKKLKLKKNIYSIRNNFCKKLTQLYQYNQINVKIDICTQEWFIPENMAIPSTQSVAGLKFDTFTDQFLLVLQEWWSDLEFIFKFQKYALKEFGPFSSEESVIESQKIIQKRSYHLDDLEVLNGELQEELKKTIQTQNELLNQRFDLIKNDSEISTQKVQFIHEFVEIQLSQIISAQDFDFSVSDNWENLVQGMKFLKTLKLNLFDQFLDANVLKMTDYKRFGMYQFNTREVFKIENTNSSKIEFMLGAIEKIRLGTDIISQSSTAEKIAFRGQIYDYKKIQQKLISQWLDKNNITPDTDLDTNLELFHRFFLNENKNQNIIQYESTKQSFLLEYKNSFQPIQAFTLPLPGVTGVMDFESTEALQSNPRFNFQKFQPLRQLFQKLSASVLNSNNGTEMGHITNYQLAIILQEFKRNLTFYFQNSSFNLKNFDDQKKFFDENFTKICNIFSPETIISAQKFKQKNISSQLKISNKLNLVETSKQLQINSLIQQQMQLNQQRIGKVQMLIQATNNLIPGQYNQMEALIQKLYNSIIFKVHCRILYENEEINTFKDVIIEKVNAFTSEKRFKALNKLNKIINQTVFSEIIQYDQQLTTLEENLRTQTQRLRKYANLADIRYTEKSIDLTSITQLESSEMNRFEILTFHVNQINEVKQETTKQQISELTGELSTVIQELESLHEQQRISQPTKGAGKSNLSQLANNVAFPDKIQFDIQQLTNKLLELNTGIKSLKFDTNSLKSNLIDQTSQIEQINVRNKQKLKQMKDKRNAVIQSVQAMTTAKEMMQKGIEQGIVLGEVQMKENVVELGRRLQQERVNCRREEKRYREMASVVQEFENEAEKRRNGLFL